MARRALIIANDAYEDVRLRRLRAPAKDAEALARVLSDPDIGGFHVELTNNEPEALLRRRIAAFFANRDRDDVLLLHLSCHGLKDETGELYFATSDTDVAQLDATAISSEFVSRQMLRSRSRQIVLLLDCCYSGAVARGLRFRAGDGVEVQEHLGGRGRAVITASSAMEYAFEGDELSGEGNPSVFTSAVVKGLETGEADRDQDRRISVGDLYEYVCDQVRDVTPNQLPNMFSHLEGDLYVARSSYVAPVQPEELHQGLQDAIASPFADVRAGAVGVLRTLLTGPNRGLAKSSHDALLLLQHDDSRRVAEAATAVLHEHARQSTSAETDSATPREVVPVPEEHVPPSVAPTPTGSPVRAASSNTASTPVTTTADSETTGHPQATREESSAVPVATPWPRRVVAFVVDWLMYILAYLVIVAICLGETGHLSPVGIVFVATSPVVLPFLLCLPHLRDGRTVGKRLLALSVISTDDGALRLSQVLYREFVKTWSLYIGTLLIVPALLEARVAVRDARGRAVHDRLASTMVTATLRSSTNAPPS